MALEIIPEFLHFKQSIPVAGHDFRITGQEAIVELLERLEMIRGWQIPHLSKNPRAAVQAMFASGRFVEDGFRNPAL